MNERPKIFVTTHVEEHEFQYLGKVYFAEWHTCCGWLFTDWERNGIKKPSTPLMNHFQKLLKDGHFQKNPSLPDAESPNQ